MVFIKVPPQFAVRFAYNVMDVLVKSNIRGLIVCPTYCFMHCLHCNRYTTRLLWQFSGFAPGVIGKHFAFNKVAGVVKSLAHVT